MRKLAVIMCIALLLSGCMGGNQELDRAMELRALLLSNSCSFQTEITADYGDKIHTFGMYCEADSQGNVGFSVTSPDSISGITGRFSNREGQLTFDDVALTFPLLADGQVTPVSAPYILIKTLQGGYVRSVGLDGDYLRVTIDDSYEEDALQVDIWLDGNNLPIRAEILYDGRRILSMAITDFRFL